jgi:hypothetical protein
MEIQKLVKLTKNLTNYFHSKGKKYITEDEYRICQSLLSHEIDLKMLHRALLIIENDIICFGDIRVSKRKND